MLEKAKQFAGKTYVQQFKDVRVLGLLVFGVIALLVTWSGLGAIQANFVLQKQVSRLQQENQVKELENVNLKLKNQYYNTDQYLELQARKQFGKAAPGESLILVPKTVALKYTVDEKKEQKPAEVQKPAKPVYQQNFEDWMRFFFRSEQQL